MIILPLIINRIIIGIHNNIGDKDGNRPEVCLEMRL